MLVFAASLLAVAILLRFMIFSDTLRNETAIWALLGPFSSYLSGIMFSEPYVSHSTGIEKAMNALFLAFLIPFGLLWCVFRLSAKLIPIFAFIWYLVGFVMQSAGI